MTQNKKSITRSTKTSLKFSNLGKRRDLSLFVDDYSKLVRDFVDILWCQDKIQGFASKEITSIPETRLSCKIRQCAAKQARGIIKNSHKKRKAKLFVAKQLRQKGEIQQAEKLELLYNTSTKPDPKSITPALDRRFIKLDWDNSTDTFDGILTLKEIATKTKIIFPVKKTKHFNKLLSRYELKPSIQISKKEITFIFEKEVMPVETGITVGLDVGISTAISCSDGSTSGKLNGHDLTSIMKLLERKTKGSKAFARTQKHRTDFINWVINQLNLDGVSQINREDITDLRRGRKSNRFMSGWTYPAIFDKLESYCEERGVRVHKVNPAYTSQRCSCCGWTHKSNRKGKEFECTSCGYAADADLNAAINISLDLATPNPVSKGFEWNPEQAPIVPVHPRN